MNSKTSTFSKLQLFKKSQITTKKTGFTHLKTQKKKIIIIISVGSRSDEGPSKEISNLRLIVERIQSDYLMKYSQAVTKRWPIRDGRGRAID